MYPMNIRQEPDYLTRWGEYTIEHADDQLQILYQNTIVHSIKKDNRFDNIEFIPGYMILWGNSKLCCVFSIIKHGKN